MVFKPFKPPLLLHNNLNRSLPCDAESQPPAKKRRTDILPEENTSNPTFQSSNTSVRTSSAATDISETVFKRVAESQTNEAAPAISNNAPLTIYAVLWRKFTTKKHKTWEGDGVLSVTGGFATLQDESGRQLGRIPYSSPLLPGSTLSMAGKEIEVQSMVSKGDFMAKRPFLGAEGKPTVRELDEKLRTNIKFNSPSGITPQARNAEAEKKSKSILEVKPHAPPKITPTANQAGNTSFKTPLLSNNVLQRGTGEKPVPRHDPSAPDALVMKRPRRAPQGKQLVDVVVDPVISRHLREHQREGVKFLYECVMGMRAESGVGAVLADEMGLGKTLQVIALLWTLLKQNPIHNEKPVIRKALIVCPVTLIANWRKEFRKWLGYDSVGVFIADDDKQKISHFTKGRSYSVMIIGYERLRNVQEELRKSDVVDIVIADEGHRLKSAKNKSAEAIKSLQTERRIILSGTPLQNDLSEFYFMVDFVNPGLLGKMNAFKKEFEMPILKSRQPGADKESIEKGQARSQELARLTSNFIIRRTAELLADFLPPKTEYVLFCKPTSAQTSVYRKIVHSPVFGTALCSSDSQLQLITILKKVCNSPNLLQAKEESSKETINSTVASLLSDVQPSLLRSPGASGKLQVLDSLLHQIRTTSSEKVVIVSHYTTTLDLIATLLNSLSYKWLRLDGSTPPSKRQKLVDRFNVSDASTCFVFLLSAKSGGVGLNLIGASRLIMFDIDWNPSTELQAMARIHRDGQKRPCWIYRLLTQGAMDEKIYQRQLTKLSLADSIVDNKDSKPHFTPEELRDLFSLDETSHCQTHDLLGCSCQGRGHTSAITPPIAEDSGDSNDEDEDEKPRLPKIRFGATQEHVDAAERFMKARKQKDANKMSALMRYQHWNAALFVRDGRTIEPDGENESHDVMMEDGVLLNVLKDSESRISFVFAKSSA